MDRILAHTREIESTMRSTLIITGTGMTNKRLQNLYCVLFSFYILNALTFPSGLLPRQPVKTPAVKIAPVSVFVRVSLEAFGDIHRVFIALFLQ